MLHFSAILNLTVNRVIIATCEDLMHIIVIISDFLCVTRNLYASIEPPLSLTVHEKV